jgi:Ca-activated chloride channel family protein
MKSVLALLAAVALAGPGLALGQKPSPKTKDSQASLKPQAQAKQDKQDKQDPADATMESDDTIKLGTELVNVLFSVVDQNNRIVSNLNQNEVTVLDDGRPQEMFAFRREVNLPVNIAILIDLSGSQEYTFPEEKRAAGYFLHSIIRPGKDSAALLTFQDDVDLVQGLTSQMDTINRALDEVEYSRRVGPLTSRNKATALYDAMYITVDEVLGREELRRGTEDSTSRRAIILLTDGVDNASNRKLEEAIDRAWRSGVMIYCIGIGDRFRFEGVREDILQRVSEATGGRAYFPRGSDELLDNFRQIETELRSQYLVAYSPAGSSRDGAFHKIEVQVKNRPGVRIIHRRGYYAPTEDVKK